jgi:hypothetical protein
MTNEQPEIMYGLINEDSILVNCVIAVEGDIETLNLLLEHHNAVAYHVINPKLYLINVGEMYWTGTGWELLENRPA